MPKKIFILLPDGVGLRNFAFTKFLETGKAAGHEVIFWNNTTFNLSDIGAQEIKIKSSKLHLLTDLLKSAKINIGLNLFIKRYADQVYETYRFPYLNINLKYRLRNSISKAVIKLCNSENGLRRVERIIDWLERKTPYYQDSLQTLLAEKPDLVLCTNQRHVSAIAPLLAARDLNIPTATFIFSWDNLPKSTMIVAADYYLVWSEFMKEELLKYYPKIQRPQIFITGTTQFEPHFDASLLWSKEDFFKQYQLDINKRYLCFSGDDITTSPDDEQYLEDLATAIEKINAKGNNLGIIFRRCPVDFSDRYDAVLKKHPQTIVAIDPKWKQLGETWNTVMPTAEDLQLQVNIIANSMFVVNIASSMVFDFAAFAKPCFYINYNASKKRVENWNAQTIYNFVHFRSMPEKDSVYWFENADEMAEKIENVLKGDSSATVAKAQKWFEIINQHPPQKASERFWEAIATITRKK
ncbi:MAG: UDP-glycosyltransferase [Bacteroidetes bacterium]|nr:UDP-glycosyltransferase [Bacteroidota bacterium]